ncbi:MAG: hypothetical protein DRP82_02365 [Planctomycetota bacterium]|nr:MAG: hypothetical protein DRP82_02365 [Planctomycetota bacterium]
MQVEPREWCFAAVLKACDAKTRPAGLGPYTDDWWNDLNRAIRDFVIDQGLMLISRWYETFYDDKTRRARVRSAHLKQSHVVFSTYPEFDAIALWLVSCKPLDFGRCTESLQRCLKKNGAPATLRSAWLARLEFNGNGQANFEASD